MRKTSSMRFAPWKRGFIIESIITAIEHYLADHLDGRSATEEPPRTPLASKRLRPEAEEAHGPVRLRQLFGC